MSTTNLMPWLEISTKYHQKSYQIPNLQRFADVEIGSRHLVMAYVPSKKAGRAPWNWRRDVGAFDKARTLVLGECERFLIKTKGSTSKRKFELSKQCVKTTDRGFRLIWCPEFVWYSHQFKRGPWIWGFLDLKSFQKEQNSKKQHCNF